jgi:hypothetical protein
MITPATPGVYLAIFADDSCIYTTDRKAGYILRKIAARSQLN